MNRRAVRVTTGMAAGLLLCGATTGCSSSGGSSPAKSASAAPSEAASGAPAAAVQSASKKAAELKSLRVEMSGIGPGVPGRMKAELAMNMDPKAMEMNVELADHGEDGRFTLKLVGDAMYMGGNEKISDRLDGKHWLKMPLKGKMKDALGGMGAAHQDPSAQTGLLSGSKDIKKVGEETVNGIPATHYAGSVTLDEMAGAAGKDGSDATKERRRKTVEQLRQQGMQKLDVDLWIAKDNRPVQLRERGQADKGPLDMTMVFKDFDKPVTVEAPAADDTADMGDRPAGGLGEAGKSL
ncbi:hypothetical protein FHS39_003585 [Streptomyces olivoverticillatus]|uniref:Lipoprotein n=1 Tax=Streptomyces olivoverticillatus TaxID=66427 RepID=A0A7W7PLR1_9ACTN|nr:hypothetical protein [Streptomyces olivoverticillatus]MBB4894527.1 hypothetical protein [Streptomyces olivoverticillatus]